MKKLFIYYSLTGSGEANKALEKVKVLGDIIILKEPKKHKEELEKINF